MDTTRVFDTLDKKIERLLARLKSLETENEKLKADLASARFDAIHPAWTGRAIYQSQASRFRLPEERLHEVARSFVEEPHAAIEGERVVVGPVLDAVPVASRTEGSDSRSCHIIWAAVAARIAEPVFPTAPATMSRWP